MNEKDSRKGGEATLLLQQPEMKTCPRCGAHFGCGASAGSCWCASLPPTLPVPEEGGGGGCGCYCPACLAGILAARK